MPAGKESARERSLSGDFDESDDESHADGAETAGKPGRKKNPNSQAARRDQNRIAQREFRLRKQQRIRDLEARVELLSGGKDEVVGEMRNILKDLMEENQTLRNLLRGVSGFIGEGAGGLLPKLGWEMADFQNFINRSETDTAWESFQLRKKEGTSGLSHKRTADGDSANGPSKKARSDKDNDNYSFASMQPATSLSVNNLYPSSIRSPVESNGIFSDMMQGSGGSPMFSSTPTASQYVAPSPNGVAGFSPSYGGMHAPANSQSASMPPPFSSGTNGPLQRKDMSPPPELEDDDDPKKNEAVKLVRYHLDNYKRNSAYCLPASLRPTLVQRSVPHESIIDSILHPEVRDRMILLRGRFDLVDCLFEYKKSVTIHGDDVLAHNNWEIAEPWLRLYGYLVDQPTLVICNRWRRERGDAEIRISEIAPPEIAA